MLLSNESMLIQSSSTSLPFLEIPTFLLYYVALVLERTVPTERQPLVGEVRVSRDQRGGPLRP
jgi:hypothetical protein